jgi:hypothetical protein
VPVFAVTIQKATAGNHLPILAPPPGLAHYIHQIHQIHHIQYEQAKTAASWLTSTAGGGRMYLVYQGHVSPIDRGGVECLTGVFLSMWLQTWGS